MATRICATGQHPQEVVDDLATAVEVRVDEGSRAGQEQYGEQDQRPVPLDRQQRYLDRPRRQPEHEAEPVQGWHRQQVEDRQQDVDVDEGLHVGKDARVQPQRRVRGDQDHERRGQDVRDGPGQRRQRPAKVRVAHVAWIDRHRTTPTDRTDQDHQRPERIEVLQRVQRQAANAARQVVAEQRRDEAVAELVDRDGQDQGDKEWQPADQPAQAGAAIEQAHLVEQQQDQDGQADVLDWRDSWPTPRRPRRRGARVINSGLGAHGWRDDKRQAAWPL